MHKYCPLENENARPTYNVQKEKIVGQVARDVPRIYAALEDCHADHQSTVVEFSSNIVEKSISILIDPGSTHSYIILKVVEVSIGNLG